MRVCNEVRARGGQIRWKGLNQPRSAVARSYCNSTETSAYRCEMERSVSITDVRVIFEVVKGKRCGDPSSRISTHMGLQRPGNIDMRAKE